VALGQALLPVLQLYPVRIIPPILHPHLHLQTASTRRTSERSLGTFKLQMLFRNWGSIWLQTLWLCLVKAVSLLRLRVEGLDPRSIHLWWTKWHWDNFLTHYFGFPLSVLFHQRSIFIFT
jgi:hypothetical protein